jgi:hypothetical protein
MGRGDHVEVVRFGYTHHGIDIGDGTVVHFTGEPGRKSAAQVQRTSWADFARGGRCRTVAHSGVTWTADHTCLRALRLIGLTGYDLVRNNCEHFATFCKTGQMRSAQIQRSVNNVWKYSRLGLANPPAFLAGPAYELARRVAVGLTGQFRELVGSEPDSGIAPPPVDGNVDLMSMFHYGDLHVHTKDGPGQVLFATPYGTHFRMFDDKMIDRPPPGIQFFGRLLVDDTLLSYLWRADGGIFRFAVADNDMRYQFSIFGAEGTTYRMTPDGSWDYFAGTGWCPSTAPANAVLQAYVFGDATGQISLRTSAGWYVGRGSDWVLHEPDRPPLRYI